MNTNLISLAIAAGVIIYGIMLYNKLVKNRQMVEEGWSGIDVQLKRRSNLIPNLLAAVKGYMTHEQDLLEKVTELRSQAGAAGGSVAERSKTEGLLGSMLGRVLAVAEDYPDLKANENFIDFQNNLEEIEDQIQMARRYYNGTARNLNILVESFPSVLVARFFGFQKAEYFELENPDDRAVPQVDFS